jgi:hypothetical protein
VAAAEPADPGTTAGTFVIRERSSDTDEHNKHISAFFQFDISQLLVFDVANGDRAKISLELQGRLNGIKDAALFVAQVTGGSWDATVNLPNYNWATKSPATVGPGSQINETMIVSNIKTASLNTEYSIDITDIMNSWKNDLEPNYGIGIYLFDNDQGAGMDNIKITISNIGPTPTPTPLPSPIEFPVLPTPTVSADVYLYWGLTDGGNVLADWENVAFVGSYHVPSELEFPVNDLLPNTTYYYRYYAVNDLTGDWASPTKLFETMP